MRIEMKSTSWNSVLDATNHSKSFDIFFNLLANQVHLEAAKAAKRPSFETISILG